MATADPVVPARPPRRRRGGAAFALAGVAALALIAGVVIWAPWRSPPLLRPGGLRASGSTASSVSFRWARPATGPAPDRYLILRAGKVIGSIPGTVTAYSDHGLAPDTAYQYRVAAQRGGKRSAPSAVLTVRTAVPPLSAARWQGQSTVDIEILQGATALRGQGPKGWTESWRATPQCPAGPCSVLLTGGLNQHTFTVTLARAGAVYRGTATAVVFSCGKPADAVPIKSTLTIQITLTSGQTDHGVWVARAWGGRMVISTPYISTRTFYCSAFQLATTVSGGF